MGGITSGVGLFSGIDTATLIDQLLAIEARPRTFAQSRIIDLQRQQAAFLSINSSLAAIDSAASRFVDDKVFDTRSATSTDPEALSATATSRATQGTFTFLVDRLVTSQQRLSRGFADRDVGSIGADRFTFEIGGGGVASQTTLAELNGGQGVSRGEIEITDKAGATATVDLSRAVTVDDVVEAINASGGIEVSAAVDGDRLTLTDTSGGVGRLIVADAFGSDAASTLGIAGETASGAGDVTLAGGDVRTVSGATALSLLSDGNGVHIRDGAADIKITARDGTVLNIDFGRQTQAVFSEDVPAFGFSEGDPVPDTLPDGLEDPPTRTEVIQARATTLQDVIDLINASASDAGIDFTAGINASGTGLVLNDNTGGVGNLIVENQANRTTAGDLGILTDAAGVASSSLIGDRVIAGINSTLTRNLAGGAGITEDAITLTDRAGNTTSFTLSAAALAGSVSDVVAEINAAAEGAGVGLTASLNRAGNGLSLSDSSGGSGNLVVSGAGAEALGIDTAGLAASTLDGANLQSRWVSLGTRLDDLRVGQGIGEGTLRITDSTGATSLVDIDDGVETMADLISLINSRPGISVEAAINDQGDGLIIRDTAGGSQDLVIADVEGSTARNLNIRGTFTDEGSGAAADGSYERVVTFDADDTLDDVVSKINLEGVGVTASVINDGGANPFRISFSSQFSGTAGRALIDTGGLDLGLTTLSEGSDAVVFYGSADPAKAILLTSSTNTLDDVVTGVTIDLKRTSSDPIELTVARDNEAAEQAIEGLVEAFNGAIDSITSATFFDSETEASGALLGDSTAAAVRSALLRTVQGEAQGVEGDFQFLFQVGVRIGSGSKLEFDRDRFRAALDEDFENVRDLFAAQTREATADIELAPGVTTPNTEESFSALGLAGQLQRLVDSMTNSIDGLLTQKDQTLDAQIDLQEDRIERIDRQLASRRAVLEQEFIAMEQAIASLQQQQAALGSLSFAG